MNENGLGFVSGQMFEVGEEITVAWRLGPGEPPLHVRCVVRYASQTTTGVEFLDLRLADRMRISHYLITSIKRSSSALPANKER